MQQSGAEPGTSVNINKLAAVSRYHKPDPLVWLLGWGNEARVVVDGVEMMALVDTGSQICTPTEGFCTEMTLKILPLRNLMEVYCVSRGWEHSDTTQKIHRG